MKSESSAICFSLNGSWCFIKDEESSLSITEIAARAEQDRFDGVINVPMNWELEGLHNFNGTLWYFIKFKYDHKPAGIELALLKFEGVDYFAEVYVNGKFAGRHEGFFQTFEFEISRLINYSQTNTLIVRVTSPKEIPGEVWPLKKQLIKGIFNHHDCRPGAWNPDYGQDYNTGGIWNSVSLVTGLHAYITNCKIKPKLSGNASCRILVELEHINRLDAGEDTTIKYQIKLRGKKLISAEADMFVNALSGTASFSFDITEPKLWNTWDIGEPILYSLEIYSSLFGNVSYNFGIKEVSLNADEQFFLNGKRLFLRGTNIIPEQMLASLSTDRIAGIAALMREANINIVRVHAHVNRREFYEEMDKAGILVWQDFALQWTYDDSPRFLANAVSQIQDMVSQLFNHPSIAFWCCHNEPGPQIRSLDPFLYDAVLSVDNSRVIRLASNYEEHPYDGWYWGKMDHFAATPMGPLVTEFGAQALPDYQSLKKFISAPALKEYQWPEWEYHDFQYTQTFQIAKIDRGDSVADFISNSQRYQADYLKTAIAYYRRKKNNGITGAFQFMFIDCWPSITWSVVDYYGLKKKGFYVLKHAFEPVHLSVNTRQSDYLPGSKLGLDFYLINDTYMVYKECSIVLSRNGKPLHWIDGIAMNADSISIIDWEAWKFMLPKSLKEGAHVLKIELINKNKNECLSAEEIVINIISKR